RSALSRQLRRRARQCGDRVPVARRQQIGGGEPTAADAGHVFQPQIVGGTGRAVAPRGADGDRRQGPAQSAQGGGTARDLGGKEFLGGIAALQQAHRLGRRRGSR